MAGALVASPAAAMVPREQPPAPNEPNERDGCEVWHGQVHGNDPDVAVIASLCDDGHHHVTGTLSWSSPRSGHSVRELSGEWSSDHRALTLHDVRLIASDPNPQWRFCRVDEYQLARGGDGSMRGSYVSNACSDHATIALAH